MCSSDLDITLQVQEAPTITSTTGVVHACIGVPKNIVVVATTSCGPLSYLWSEDGNKTTNDTATFSIANPTVNDSNKSLSCLITDVQGQTVEATFTLIVDHVVLSPLSLASAEVCTGDSFSVTLPPPLSSDNASLSYQWFGPSGLLLGKTGTTLTLAGAALGMAQSGSYYCRVTLPSATCGTIVENSSSCVLSVTDKPTITSAGGVGPITQHACIGTGKVLAVTATSPCGPISYRWSYAGTPLS